MPLVPDFDKLPLPPTVATVAAVVLVVLLLYLLGLLAFNRTLGAGRNFRRFKRGE
jgi:hypothetical protein